MDNVIDILEKRGILEAVTSPDVRALVNSPTAAYAGFDPSARSLQVGNLVAVMGLCHFQRCGHKVVALTGGATGAIGDPSGRSSERELLGAEDIRRNLEGIRENLSRFLDFEDRRAPARIVNNDDWMGGFTFVGFLREVGKHFRMGAMLGKESVRARLESDGGMSYAEFSYQLIQAYDFLHLLDTEGCRVQLGGSDQWGNITAGTDLIRKLRNVEAYGVTFPLVCDSTGQKFGKSEGNALYLDHRLTPYYDFYQFFIRTDDADVVRFLKIFTFLSLEEIEEIRRAMEAAPEARAAQRKLAEEMTRMVHGEKGLRIAEKASSVLFGGSLEDLRADELLDIFANVPSSTLPMNEIRDALASDVAAASGLCASKGEARRLIASGGLYVNGIRVESAGSRLNASDIIDNKVVVLRSGKKTFRLVKTI
jgi:tyrosyl-tRNA synthetase